MSEKPAKRVRLTGALPPRTMYCERFRCLQLTVGRELEFRLQGKDLTERDRVRYQRELFELSRVDSPFLLPVVDSGGTKGRAFYTVPLRHDPTVASLLEAGDLELEDLAQVTRSVAGAMAALHVRAFRFSDPDPALIAWDPLGGHAYMLHHHGGDAPGADVAVPSDVRDPAGGPAADVFRWGRFAYRLLTGGREPYPRPEQLAPIQDLVPALAPDLGHCIQVSLAWDPAARPESGMVLQAVLQRSGQNLVRDAASVERITGLGSREYLEEELERLVDSLRIQQVREAGDLPSEAPDAGAVEAGIFDDSLAEVALLEPARAAPAGEAAEPQAAAPGPGALVLAAVAALGLGLGIQLGGAGGPAGSAATPALPEPAAVVVSPAEPEVPVEPPGTPRVLPPSTAAPFLRDGRVRVLLEAGPVTPETFPALRKVARDLALANRLPASLAATDRVVELRRTFAADPARGCAELQAMLDELKKVLDYRPGA